jgi:hypothetical protein
VTASVTSWNRSFVNSGTRGRAFKSPQARHPRPFPTLDKNRSVPATAYAAHSGKVPEERAGKHIGEVLRCKDQQRLANGAAMLGPAHFWGIQHCKQGVNDAAALVLATDLPPNCKPAPKNSKIGVQVFGIVNSYLEVDRGPGQSVDAIR